MCLCVCVHVRVVYTWAHTRKASIDLHAQTNNKFVIMTHKCTIFQYYTDLLAEVRILQLEIL